MRRLFGGLNFRLFVTYALIIFLTLTLAGLTLIVTIGGYREQLAEGTLRDVAAPFYQNLALSAAGVRAPRASASSCSARTRTPTSSACW
jgi:hypothetical protein